MIARCSWPNCTCCRDCGRVRCGHALNMPIKNRKLFAFGLVAFAAVALLVAVLHHLAPMRLQ